MPSLLRTGAVVAVLFCSQALVSAVKADFLFTDPFSTPILVRNNGSFVGYYDDLLGGGSPYNIVTLNAGTISGDGERVHALAGAFGDFYSFNFDLDTGELIDIVVLDMSTTTSPPALARANDPFGHGDLFLPTMDTIWSLDSATGAVLGQIDSPESDPGDNEIEDFDLGPGTFGPDTRVYFAAGNSIYVFDDTPSGFQADTSNPLITGLTSNENLRVATGPDGNLYVLDGPSSNLEIHRYNGVTGAFVDVFLTNAELNNHIFAPNFSNFAFGPGGDLYVSTFTSYEPTEIVVSRYDISTGQRLAEYFSIYGIESDSFLVVSDPPLPVPEPGTLALVLIGSTLLVWRLPGCRA